MFKQKSQYSLFVLVALLLLTVWLVFPATAQAEIRRLEEAPGQMLYQTRASIRDQFGNRWQAIAFKRHKADDSEFVGLRLVAFPGSVAIDRSQPLRISDPLGRTLTLPDASAKIFTDAAQPEPYVGQYDLGVALASLEPAVPLEIEVPTVNDDPIMLVVSPAIVQDWRELL